MRVVATGYDSRMELGLFLKKYHGFIGFSVFIFALAILLFVVGPEKIIAAIGVEGGYLLIFVTALIGVSAFTSGSFYATVIAFASTGEFNPLLIGLTAAPAMAVGHTLFFFLGIYSQPLVGKQVVMRLSEWMYQREAKWAAPAFAYLYTAFTPLPQDFLMLALGLGGTPFRRVIIPVLLGNVTFITLLSFFVLKGFSL